jgi:hypothetical protein
MGLWLNQATGCGLDRGLGSRRRAKLDPSVIYVKIDRALGQIKLARYFSGRLAACHQGQYLDLTIPQVHELRPQIGPRYPGQLGINDRS